jgi:hypothetical protein
MYQRDLRDLRPKIKIMINDTSKKTQFRVQCNTKVTMANTVDLLPANLQNTLHQIIDRANNSNGGIRVILLSTAEGVPLGRVFADRNTPLNEDVLTNIESIWAPASKQFALLDMGKEPKVVTAIYDHGKTSI